MKYFLATAIVLAFAAPALAQIKVDREGFFQKGFAEGMQRQKELREKEKTEQGEKPRCTALSLPPLASVGCKNVCINGQWAEVC